MNCSICNLLKSISKVIAPVLLLMLGLLSESVAQECVSDPSLLVKWDFTNAQECNGVVTTKRKYWKPDVPLMTGGNQYCPQINDGSGQAIIYEQGFGNTNDFKEAMCVAGFWKNGGNKYFRAPGYDASSPDYDPDNLSGNIWIDYNFLPGQAGSLSSFQYNFLQNGYKDGGVVAFDKWGVTVLRNGITVFVETLTITAANVNNPANPLTVSFPNTSEFKTDGSTDVKWSIGFALVKRNKSARSGIDNLCIFGTAGQAAADVQSTPATCESGGVDGQLEIVGFSAGEKYDFNVGSSYTGVATFATASTIPADGIIANNLPLATEATDYSVRIFRADCYIDAVVIMAPVFCPYTCDFPIADVLPSPASCVNEILQDDATIVLTNIVDMDRVGISVGQTYTGPDYAGAIDLGGAPTYTFDDTDGVASGTCTEYFTLRFFNGLEDSEKCIADRIVALSPVSCDGCQVICAELVGTDSEESNSSNDLGQGTACKTDEKVDLQLTKIVDQSTGSNCDANGSGTNFIFTVTLENIGDLAAENVTIADVFPDEMAIVSITVSDGTPLESFGTIDWKLPTVAAGASETMVVTASFIEAGSYQNCVEVLTVTPANDPDNSNDTDCAMVTVTGVNLPHIEKAFSPAFARANVPIRLSLKLFNNESNPIALTQDLVDDLPSSPGQMVIANTPNLSSALPGIIADAGSSQFIVPTGTVLQPGLNSIQLDVVAPTNGDYINIIMPGDLVTTSCSNVSETRAEVNMADENVIGPLLTKAFSNDMLSLGQTTTLTITIENRNPESITLLADFFDVLPDGLTVTGIPTSSCGGASTFGESDRVGITSGTVISGNSDCTIEVEVEATGAGFHCNRIPFNAVIVEVNLSGGGVMTSNEDIAEACLEVVNTPVFDLALRKSLSEGQSSEVGVGSVVNYDITIFNQGTEEALDVQVTDYMSADLIFVDDANWELSGDDVILTTPIPSILPGASVTIPIQFTVDPTFTGESITNVAEISSVANITQDKDSSPDNNKDNDNGGLVESTSDDVIFGDATMPGGAPLDANGLTDEDDADPAIVFVTVACLMEVTVIAGNCIPTDGNYYDLTGSITFTDPPTNGSLTISIDDVIVETLNSFASPQAFTIVDLVSDGLLHTVTTTFSDDANCIMSFDYTAPDACFTQVTSGPCTDGNLGGIVFNDQNANGNNDDGVNSANLENIQVQIFACNANGNNELIETVNTDENGEYHFSNPQIVFDGDIVYQVVFSNLPVDYISSSLSTNSGTEIQYVTQLGCDIDYGILHPDFACATPDLEESIVVGNELFSSGTLLGPGIALITCGTIVNLPANERHTVGLVDIKGIDTESNRPEVNPNGWYHPSWSVDTIGNVFGIDYDTTGNIYVTASSHFSHVYGYILGPDASNYTQSIIKYGDLGGGTDDLGAAGTIYKLDAVTGEASVFAQLPQQAFTFNHYACEAADPPLGRTTGPGLGNIVFDQTNNQFFVSNFEDGKIYRIDTQGNTINSFDPQTLGVFSAYNGSAGWATDAKPYGLAVNKEGTELFFGTHELNTTPGLYSVDLLDGDFSGTERFHRTYPAEGDIGYLYAAEPGWIAISDLEFLPNGTIMIGTRTGCAGQYATSHNHGATFYIADEEGDGIFDNIISNPDIQYPNDGTGNDDGYGGIGIWDKHDGTYDFLVSSSDTRTEEGPHGMILFPHDFTNGNSGFSLQPSAAIPYLPSFNVQDFKGIGGDVEVFSPCGEAPIHVGNYAWIDSNGDGIQDACEAPMSNLTVKLYTKPIVGDPLLVATTVTNNLGEYYFSDSTNVDQNWEDDFANIEKDSSYYIAFCGDSYDSTSEIITVDGSLLSVSPENMEMTLGGDLVDSDITNISIPNLGEFPAICITADETNYTYDAGFIPKPDMALMMIVDPDFDDTGLTFGDSVKFRIVVYNQSLASVDSVDIIDYMPTGYTFDNGIAGNENWTADGAGNPTTKISQVVAPGEADSVCIYLTVEPTDDATNWINVAEISAAYQGGILVEDCDSPLNSDPMDNGGSDINTEADNEIGGDGTATGADGVAATDQDNVDPAAVAICDLALINVIDEIPTSLTLGDTVKFAVIVENQGTVTADNIDIQYTIPDGFTYLDRNNDSGPTEPNWSEDLQGADLTITDELGIGEFDTVCIYLAVNNLTLAEANEDAYTTFAEISAFEDPNDPGVDKSDFDSTPNSDETDDLGGNPDDDTDDETGGTGEGTGDPADDSNPDLDEDDHDAAIVYVCDAATIIYTDHDQSIIYGDTIKFNVVVFNQGNGPITNIDLNDFHGSGLEFISTPINDTENWVSVNNQLSITVTDVIESGESDTTCLELLIVDWIPFDDDAYLQVIEIANFEDPSNPGIPKTDIDSTPDDNPENDSGGNLLDDTDNESEGDGTGDPENPSEDSDPQLDEDDHDPVMVYVFDLALNKIVQDDRVYSPGEKPVFEMTVHNQGNMAAMSYKIIDYLNTGFSFSTTNNLGWSEDGDNVVYTSNEVLEPGDTKTIALELTVIIPTSPVGVSDWWNYAEIMENDDDTNTSNNDPLDADSDPNDSKGDDNLVIPDDENDNVINQNGNQGGDEDDHDPAKVIVGYDLALRKTVSPQGPYSYDDTLTYTITIFNQGGLSVSDVDVYDSIPCGFEYLGNINDWDYADGIATTTLEDILSPGGMVSKEIKLKIIRCEDPAYENYLNIAEISDFSDDTGDEPLTDDLDSTPDSNPSNDGEVIDNDIDPNTPDQDDHDFEDIEICDLALKNVIVEYNDPPFAGDTIKYEVVVFNQGNGDANSVTVDYLIPNGLTFLPVNNTLDPVWTSTSISEAIVVLDNVLQPGESDTVCIYLQLENLQTDDVTVDSWTTIAEISEYTDGDDETKTTDVDSTPDDDFTNDPGGNPNDDTNDVVDGNGEGDPNDPTEDSNPDLDEDDHDPEIIDVCDAAIFVETDDAGPYKYKDTIKYFVIVHNQGNGDITNINIQDVYDEGLEYIDDPINSILGWTPAGPGELNLMVTNVIEPGDRDTTCLYMKILPDHESSEDSWKEAVEVITFESPENPGVPIKDVDNPPSLPPIEKDLDDIIDIEICDAALINTIVEVNDPAQVGDTVKYEVIITNQGNNIMNGTNIDYTIGNGLVYLPVNDSQIPSWNEVNPLLAQVSTTEVLNPGESDTLCIYLEMINLPSSEVSPESWTTVAEITSTIDEAGDVKTEDVDSTPDDDPTNDPGGNPEDETDDEVTGDGTGDPADPTEDMDPTLDEDDHDPAIVEVCDAATIIDTDETGPFSYGDTLKYFIEIHNQGNGDITNVELQNLYGEGLSYVENTENTTTGWVMEQEGELSLTYDIVIPPGELDSICIYMEVVPAYPSTETSWVQNVEIVSYEDPEEPEEPKPDFDSTPDDDPTNDPGGNPNDPDTDDETGGDGTGDPEDEEENTDPLVDEDDQDVEDIEICDLALVNVIMNIPTTPNVDDTLKYEVIITNQGNHITNGVNIDYQIPIGLGYLPINDDLTPSWNEVNSGLAQVSTTEAIAPGESDTVCFYLQIMNLPTPSSMDESWVTIAEIISFLDEEGDLKTEDVDSTPDSDPDNDPGGNYDDDTDNEITGDGTGDPTDPTEDMDPTLDEDDHDPTNLFVCDVALIIDTEDEGPIAYGDTIKYFVEIHNQGNGPITNIDIQNLYGDGLVYLDNAENTTAGWEMDSEGELSILIDEVLVPGEIDTICLLVEVQQDDTVDVDSWTNNVEVVSFEDPADPGVPKHDVDSTPDDIPDNDPGGNSDDSTDDTTDGNGSGDPEDPTEDTDPTLDEDDQDIELVDVYDIALKKELEYPDSVYLFGNEIEFNMILENQGNVALTNIITTDYVPASLTEVGVVGDNAAWIFSAGLAEYTYTDTLLAGDIDTVKMFMVFQLAEELEDYINVAEVSEISDTLGNNSTDNPEIVFDADSTPDADPENDPGGEPNFPGDMTGTDNTVDNENGDEDDADPLLLGFIDLALIKQPNTQQVDPGKTITFTITITNQGTIPSESIVITDYIPDGMSLSDSNWTDNGDGTATTTLDLMDDLLMFLESTTVEITLLVDDDTPSGAYVNYAEITSNFAPGGSDISEFDIDSNSDSNNTDDAGGAPETDSDDTIDGNGTNGTGTPGDENASSDEDDQDPAAFCVTPMPEIEGDFYACPGEVITYNVVPFNPVNTYAWTVTGAVESVDNNDGTITITYPEEEAAIINISVLETTVFDFCTGSDIKLGQVEEFLALACNNNVNLSLGYDCMAVISADMILEGFSYPDNSYTVTLTNQYGQVIPGNIVTLEHVGQVIEVSVTQDCFGNSCWGTMTIEHKLPPVFEDCACPIGGSELEGMFDGSLDINDPTFTRPFLNAGVCNPSGAGIDVPYDTYEFELDMDSNLGAEVVTFTAPSGDSFLALYSDSFDPLDPCGNLVTTNDDGGTGLLSQFDVMLDEGVNYILVITTFNNNGNDFGDYSVEITTDATLLSIGEECVFRCVDVDYVYNSSSITPNPTVSSCSDYDLVFFDQLTTELCGDTKIIRTWTANNEWGSSICIQEFTFESIEISELTLPDNVTDLTCGSGTTPEDIVTMFDDPLTTDNPNTPYVENNEGYAHAYPTYLVNGHPQKVDNSVCELYAVYSDQEVELCGEGCSGNVKVVRKWTLVNWCETTTAPTTHTQIIESKDTEPPTIEAEGFSVSVNPWNCLGDFNMPEPTLLHDLCSDGVTYTISGPAGATLLAPNTTANPTDLWVVLGAPKGVNTFTYTASDCCGNTASADVTVIVFDTTPPTPIALEFIVINLTTGGSFDENGVAIGVAKMYTNSVDQGSYDGCSDVKIELARETDACDVDGNETFNADGHPDDGSSNPNASNYDPDNGEFVKFCCADIDQVDPVTGVEFGLVPVRMRVFDDGNMSGFYGDFIDLNGDGDVLDAGEFDNFNETWVTVRVEGKAIASIVCPVDVTLACDMDYTDPSLIGSATTLSLCGSESVTTAFTPQLDACGVGFVIATYTIEGSNPSISCSQRITMENLYPVFDENSINYPRDLPIAATGSITCADDIPYDAPTWTAGVCDFVGYTEEVDTFFFAVDQTTGVPSDACFKILRQFTVIDWCLYDATNGQDGLYYGSQTIKITDNDAPVLNDCEPVMFDVDENCVRNSTILTNSATDSGDCASDWLKWQVLVDTWADGVIDYEYSSFLPSNDSNINNDTNGDGINDRYLAPTMSGDEVSINITEELEPSLFNHSVLWKVTDGCGNVASCTTTFMVVDKKAPSPYCVSLSTALMTDGSVELWAIDFDLGAFDNCTDQEDLRFTFSNTPPEDDNSYNAALRSSAMTFTQAGVISVDVYVWDEYGNVDFCTVTLTVNDNDGSGLRIAGVTATEIGGGVSNATVSLEAPIAEYPLTSATNESGEFAFDDNPMNEDYMITVVKNDNHKNGVSTLDLVLIQRHIVGFADLDSPYKVIAADINSDEKVSSIDVVELRKVILGVQDEFNTNTSWRFLDADQTFFDAMQPWPIDEQREIADLVTPTSEEYFVAVKIGDVNASAEHNISSSITEVRNDISKLLEIEDRAVKIGEVIDMAVSTTEFESVFGLQATIELDGMTFSDITSRALDMQASNVGVISDNIITLSWNRSTPVSTDDALFVISTIATRNGQLSDMISITDRVISPEIYTSSLGASFGTNFEIQTLELRTKAMDGLIGENTLLQNEPNPFKSWTEIGFKLAKAGAATLTVTDVTGKVLYMFTDDYNEGESTIKIEVRDLSMASGLLYYTIESGEYTETKRMIVID